MAMDQRNAFLLQLLQKLGAPLMAAVNAHAQGGDDAKAAQTMAAMLSESVKIGITLSQAMNLKPSDGDADAIRVSLTTIAAGLVAESYRQTGRVPGDADAQRIQKSLEGVIVFADNFAPAAEHAQRLQTLDNTPPFFDAIQTNLYATNAFLPALSAIAEFSFGQDPAALIQEVATRVGSKAKEINAGGDTMSEMITLQALAQVYASAHRAETAQLKNAGDGASASIDKVWTAFDKQAAMLAVLMESLGGQGAISGKAGSGGGVRPAATAPVAETPAAPVVAPPATPPPAQGGNPMSFFKKK